jgi:hypothetical protein
MSSLSFVLALAFVFAVPSIADVSDARLPGVGAFAYNGPPIVTPAPQVVVVAFR